jgi:predicted dehydrogenase
MAIKIGVLGCGSIAQNRHVAGYAKNSDVKIVAFYNKTQKTAQDLADKYGGVAFDNYQDFLNCDLDAVSVCLPNNLHASACIDLLRLGKHVLCEKPMATTKKQCLQMIKASKKSGKILMLAHNQRFALAHVKAKELINEGVIGKPLTFETHFCHSGPETWGGRKIETSWFYDKKMTPFGAFGDLGVHKIDLIHYLLDDIIKEVSATINTLEKTYPDGQKVKVDDNAHCILKTKKGVVGTLVASWSCYGEENDTTTIYGTKGVMIITPKKGISIIMRDKSTTYYDCANSDNFGVINAFINSIKTGVSAVSGQDGYKSMQVVFGAIKSSKTKRTIKIK